MEETHIPFQLTKACGKQTIGMLLSSFLILHFAFDFRTALRVELGGKETHPFVVHVLHGLKEKKKILALT